MKKMYSSIQLSIAFVLFFFHASCQQPGDVFISFKDKQLLYEGRIDTVNDAAVLSWSGTSVYFHFEGTEVKVVCSESDTANYYNVIVDGDVTEKLHFEKNKQTYLLAGGLKPGQHTLQLFKRTEWDKGKTFLYGFAGKDLQMLPAPLPPKRKIEFYGNSISCGYAIEDVTADRGVGYFENNYDAYPALTARHFNAQYQCIAKSGIGITISWFPLIMKEMYDRQDATDTNSHWDFSRYTPDVVVINLLQNDYWLTKKTDHPEYHHRFGNRKPTPEFIIQEYKSFVQQIRDKYPAAIIICMLGNMDITSAGSPWPGYVTTAVKQLGDEKIHTLFVPYKHTGGHPKTEEQKKLADTLIRFIETHVQW